MMYSLDNLNRIVIKTHDERDMILLQFPQNGQSEQHHHCIRER